MVFEVSEFSVFTAGGRASTLRSRLGFRSMAGVGNHQFFEGLRISRQRTMADSVCRPSVRGQTCAEGALRRFKV